MNGSVSYNQHLIVAQGEIDAYLGGVPIPLFSGSWQIPVGQAATDQLDETSTGGANQFQLGGMQLQLSSLSFVVPSGETTADGQLELQARVDLTPVARGPVDRGFRLQLHRHRPRRA